MLDQNTLARPRQVSWIDIQSETPAGLSLRNTRLQSEHLLNESASAIWKLCDGSRTIADLLNLFEKHYPQHTEVRQDLLAQLNTLLESKLIVLDGGSAALEYHGEVVRTIQPTAELLWQLEKIRQFLLGCTRIQEASALTNDLDTLLGAEALATAKHLDVDAASSNSDSTIVPYRAALRGKSFQKCLKKIVRELHASLPGVSSNIKVAGHALYLRGSHMGWHSNHSRSDGRIYCSWSERGESNYFRYVDPLTDEIITQWEAPGWNIKSFTIPDNTSRFWHCIGANSLRLSLGFRYELPSSSSAVATD